ncbi:MAG: PEGA domain-containing protein [Candidatus Pacearchaeota archaeon]
MKGKDWWILIGAIIIVAIVASLVTVQMTGKVIQVNPVNNGTEVYTKAEVNSIANYLTNQINTLNEEVARLNLCCPVIVNPNETMARLDLKSIPTNASIYLDSIYIGLTPSIILNISVGTHEIQVNKLGYNTYFNTKYLIAGINFLNATLTPVTNINSTGSLYMDSNPKGASLYVNNNYKGITPITVSNLSVGYNIVQLSKAGYKNYNITVYITKGQTLGLNAILTRN